MLHSDLQALFIPSAPRLPHFLSPSFQSLGCVRLLKRARYASVPLPAPVRELVPPDGRFGP